MDRLAKHLKVIWPLAAFSLFAVGVALGHGHLDEIASSPAPNGVLKTSPTEVRLVFTEGVHSGLDARQSIFWVIRIQGEVSKAYGTVDLQNVDRNVMIAKLEEPLAPGLYRVRWSVITIDDDGYSEGEYQFAVE